MSIVIQENVYDLPGEKQAILWNGADGTDNVRLAIHPWERDYRYMKAGRIAREVALSLGNLDEDGQGPDDDNGWEIGIFDRDDFVEAILAVLPELKRA